MTSEFIALLYGPIGTESYSGTDAGAVQCQGAARSHGVRRGLDRRRQAEPVSAMAFDSVTLTFNKLAGIVPITVELMRFS